MSTTDPFDLHRFIQAQEPIYPRALEELRHGNKRSHWMWFIFPQVAGLGKSSTSKMYAIKSREEAEAYLNHPLLGPRLIECCEALVRVEGKSAHEILGSPDDMKLQSCMTLFHAVNPHEPVFIQVLNKYYSAELDKRTLALLK